ncbi:MAG: hypothetical protein GX977_13410 [Firmicutes bacterium]|nr:hypothetical protein [Bacillota bacterium]
MKVYMTATPEPAMLQAARRGAMGLVTVPVRHHGHPIPVPELLIDRRHLVPDLPRQRVSPRVETCLKLPAGFWAKLQESLRAGNRVFVFVPRVWLVAEMVKAIAARLKDSGGRQEEGLFIPTVLGTHSRDARRDEKRTAFEDQTPAVMVTTSVLERGITVPRADVIILYAHDPLYDARTLMQMAGRSGRAASYPHGRVYFIAATSTRAIGWAISNLKKINAVAKERGLLVET